MLCSSLNATPAVLLTPGETYGVRDAAGRFNGLVGMVQRGDADLSLNFVTTTPDRQRAVDFPRIVRRSYNLLMAKTTTSVKSDVINVFSEGLWGVLAAAFAVSCMMAVLISSTQVCHVNLATLQIKHGFVLA